MRLNYCFYEDCFVKAWSRGTCSRHPIEVPARCDVHPDPRSGTVEGPSWCSDKLLSVRDIGVRHHMQHARQARWQSPVTDAPLLWGRSPCGDPQSLRAHRPVIMMLTSCSV